MILCESHKAIAASSSRRTLLTTVTAWNYYIY